MSFVFPGTLPSTSFPTGEIAGFFPITGVYFGLNDALAPMVFFLHFVEFQIFDMLMEMIAVLQQCTFFGPWVKLLFFCVPYFEYLRSCTPQPHQNLEWYRPSPLQQLTSNHIAYKESQMSRKLQYTVAGYISDGLGVVDVVGDHREAGRVETYFYDVFFLMFR